jgi:hypothetical protein
MRKTNTLRGGILNQTKVENARTEDEEGLGNSLLTVKRFVFAFILFIYQGCLRSESFGEVFGRFHRRKISTVCFVAEVHPPELVCSTRR